MARRRNYRKAYSYKKSRKKTEAETSALILLGLLIIAYVLKNEFDKINKSIFITPLIIISVVGVLVFIGVNYYKKYKENKKVQDHINSIETLEDLHYRFDSCPTKFEAYIADLYKIFGYDAKETKASNDGGIDVVMYKNGIKYTVETKLYSENNTIGRELIQKLHSASMHANSNNAIFITTSSFKKTAYNFVDEINKNKNNNFKLKLINGEELSKMIREARSITSKAN